MSTFLVTGGAGFIGSNIVHALVQEKHTVRVLDDLSTGRMENLAGLERVEFIKGDIRHAAMCIAACKDVDYVIHQAAMVSVQKTIEDPLAANEINVCGTNNMLNAARVTGVKKLVYASSCAVYGDKNTGALSELKPSKPISIYAATKFTNELFAEAFSTCYKVPCVGLRYFNVYGPRQNPNSDYAAVIPNFILRLLAMESPVVFGDGLQTRDFIFVGDVVRANLLACEAPIGFAPHEIINVASGKTTTVLDLARMLTAILNVDIKPVHERARPGDIRHSHADVSKAIKILGFQAGIDLKDGLMQTLEWARQQLKKRSA